MYIKIGNTNIKYKSGVDDFMIFSEIPDSQLSYEKPILVRTKDELDIWFGKDFTSREYFDELLKKGVTLYLYKPIKENNTRDIDDYIDIETYYIFPEIFYSLPKIGESGYAYYLQIFDQSKHYYKFMLRRGDNRFRWVPADTIDGCTVDPRIFPSIYDLPNVGEDNHVYYVENLPENRFWHIFEDGEWKEPENYKDYIPYKKIFTGSDSLPDSGNFKYFVIFDMSWYKWENNEWVKTTNDDPLQEFPIKFDTFDDLPWVGDNYKYYVNGVWYIWLGESWTPETIFPQNLDNLSGSLNNRDTLIISKLDNKEDEDYTGGENIPYAYPEFRLYENNHLGVFSRTYDIDFTASTNIDEEVLESINLGYKTMAIRLLYTSEELDPGYIIIKSQTETGDYEFGSNYCFNSDDKTPGAKYFSGSPTPINTVEDLINSYNNLGYKTEKIGESEYLIYSSSVFDFTEFYTYKNIVLVNDFENTHNILSNYILNYKSFEFYSKTIGTSYEDSENNKESLISVNIEKADYEKYRVTLKRYDYTEVFEGPLFSSSLGEERLDNVINKKSKLVSCELSGLKNYMKPIIYKGQITDDNLESEDFTLHFRTKDIHHYIPLSGESGYKYLVYPGLWEVWDSDTSEWMFISDNALEFYGLEELILDYPTIDSLPEVGSSEFKYYVESEDCWYTWDNDEWVVFDDIIDSTYIIKIERLGYEKYAIHIVVDDLSETFIGNIFDLEKDICSNSEILDNFKFKGLCNEIREGTYYLRRGKNEEQTRDMYIKSLDCLFDTQINNVFPDFFLVPDIKKYINKLGDTEDSYSEYKDIFLEHAKNFNCQFLIQNNEPKYKIVNIKDLKVNSFEEFDEKEIKKMEGILYFLGDENNSEYRIVENGSWKEFTDREEIDISVYGGDFIYNYTKDISNYLVYFFKPLTINGYRRPAYYVFLEGLFRNIYSFSDTVINYDSPTKSNPYELIVDDEDYVTNTLSKYLENYKSNFLINNNHIFYYKKYFNGNKYESTVWMRFVIGKIYRELEKNRWSYLSQRSIGIIETRIRTTLAKIQNSFSIVGFIDLTKFSPNMLKNYLELTIDTYVNDLMNNNMTLDITVNYNETNTD